MATLASRDRAGASAPGWVAGLILGGPALFLIGHAAFKAVIWRRVSWARVGAAAGLGLLGLLAPLVPALALAACGAAAVVAVAVADQVWRPVSEPGSPAAAGPAG
jgi:low temperature requirement protein LtrA